MVISDLSALCIASDSSIRQAIACIDRSEAKIALVVDESRRLLDAITDGDIRRAMLAGTDLDAPVAMLRDRRSTSPYYPRPVTALAGTEPAALLRLMQEREVRQVPLLDEAERVVDLVTLRELSPNEPLLFQAVVMAGGYGTRLRPLTTELPKPMLPVGDRPLLERIIDQLRKTGIRQVNLVTHYKGEIVARHFGDGQDFGIQIRHVREDQPLGTAGALSLLEATTDPLLVVNGDILTQVDFRAMLDFHKDHQADMTVAVRVYELPVPYGVVETSGIEITGILEKPILRHPINCGIYVVNPDICRYVPSGQRFDMPDLIQRLLTEGRRVISFHVREYWLDIGQEKDYQKALADVENGEV